MQHQGNLNSVQSISILIVLMGSIGDVARGLSIVVPIKKAFPNSIITWLVEPKCEDLVRLNSHIDEIIVFKRNKGVLAVTELIKHLKARKFDITLDLQRHFKSGFFSLLSAANRRIGFHRSDSKEFNWLFNTEHIPPYGDKLPKIDHYLKFLDYLNIQITRPLDFGIDKNKLSDYIPDKLKGIPRYLVLVLGSTWVTKDWFKESYQELIYKLEATAKIPIVLVGDKSKLDMANALSGESLINLVSKTTLIELIAILSRATLAIGPDSGPGHISSIFKVPYVSLFGPTDPLRTAPYGSDLLVVNAHVECSPCYKRVCPGMNQVCMRKITADMVMEKVRNVLV